MVGLFSPSVLAEKDQQIALNITKITKNEGFIAISTHERNASNFEKITNDCQSLIYEKMNGYASHVPSKHDFAKGWKAKSNYSRYYPDMKNMKDP